MCLEAILFAKTPHSPRENKGSNALGAFVCPGIDDVQDFLFNSYLPGCINSAIHNYSSQRR